MPKNPDNQPPKKPWYTNNVVLVCGTVIALSTIRYVTVAYVTHDAFMTKLEIEKLADLATQKS